MSEIKQAVAEFRKAVNARNAERYRHPNDGPEPVNLEEQAAFAMLEAFAGALDKIEDRTRRICNNLRIPE